MESYDKGGEMADVIHFPIPTISFTAVKPAVFHFYV